MKITTLCYLERNDAYLMLHRTKKEQDANKDKWIGIGGHLEDGESPEDCLLREVREETGLTLSSWSFRGAVTFVSDRWETEYMCLYTADGWTGELTECSEGDLEWVKKEDVWRLKMWEGDCIFFRLLEEGRPFFSLKLCYEGERLAGAVLDGRPLELLDICDEQGNPTGRTRERQLAHRFGDLHATSHVWIVRKNDRDSFDLLLQRRSATKDSFADCYDISSAGHIPAGSNYIESALRELAEELGISAEAGELHYAGVRKIETDTIFYGKPFHDRQVSRVYVLVRDVAPTELCLQPEEVSGVLWIDYRECRRRMENESLKNCIVPEELDMVEAWWKAHRAEGAG